MNEVPLYGTYEAVKAKDEGFGPTAGEKRHGKRENSFGASPTALAKKTGGGWEAGRSGWKDPECLAS
jgi:hypothetical protein